MTNQRVAVVTGAGQGTGRAVAQALSNAGFRVAVIGRRKAPLLETVASLAGEGAAIVADLTKPDEVRAAFAEVDRVFGGVDVLVNNAANYRPFRVDEATDSDIEDVIRATLMAPIYCMREAIPRMRARGAGDIVNMSSQSAQVPQPFLTVYGAAKAAIEVVSQGLRYELKREPFRIIVIQVGVIAGSEPPSDWPENILPRMMEAFEASGVDKHFALPGVPPEEIAATIVHAVMAPRSSSNQVIELRGPG